MACKNQASANVSPSNYNVHQHLYLQENLKLKKLVREVDMERIRVKRLLLETDEKSMALLQHNKEQETRHTIDDYTIQQVAQKSIFHLHFLE